MRGPRTKINIGGLGEDLSWRPFIDQALANTKYAWTYQNNMNEWLKSHYVMILALNSIASTYNGICAEPPKTESFFILSSMLWMRGIKYWRKRVHGYACRSKAVRPQNRKLFYILLKMILSIPISRILLSDKAVSANEVTALQQALPI